MDKIAIYCGSSTGLNEVYKREVERLGKLMVSRNYKLVYGAGSVGLMGVLADEVLRQGGEVIGVIPKFLMDWEVGHHDLTSLEVVGTMHERKMRMVELSDGFIAMPGGFGTLDELFEVLTWGQLDLHVKPIGLYNVNGFFDILIEFLKNVVKEGFVKPIYLDRLIVESDGAILLDKMSGFVLEEKDVGGKWVG